MATILWSCNMFSPAIRAERLPGGNKANKKLSLNLRSKIKNEIGFFFLHKQKHIFVHFWFVCSFVSCFNKPLMVSFRCFWMNLHCVDTRSFIEMSAGLLSFPQALLFIIGSECWAFRVNWNLSIFYVCFAN